MSFVELLFVAFGLAMDAFTVSVCKGLAVQHCRLLYMLICGLYFGSFQALMPLAGFLLGTRFEAAVQSTAPIFSFVLLSSVGINMIVHAKDEDNQDGDFSFRNMIPLALATSIDALAVGVSFAFLHMPIIFSVAIIGSVTFVCCMAGVKIGNLFGKRYKAHAEQFGGMVLVLIGLKILLPFFAGL